MPSTSLKRRITVIANCHCLPISQIIALIAPDAAVEFIDVNFLADPLHNQRAHQLEHDDGTRIIFSFFFGDEWGAVSTSRLRSIYGERLFTFTNIHFSGLHPDITYLGGMGSRIPAALGDYHSKLALFSYATKRTKEMCLDLFNDEIYRAVGYYDNFAESKLQLIRRDSRNDIKFSEIFLNMALIQPSLYTFNHPTDSVLLKLSEALCSTANITTQVIPDSYLQNVLSQNSIWPIYSEIKDFHNLPYLCPQAFVTPFRYESRALSFADFISESYSFYSNLNQKDLLNNILALPFFNGFKSVIDKHIKEARSSPRFQIESMGKTEAAVHIASELGIQNFDPIFGPVAEILQSALESNDRIYNRQFSEITSETCKDARIATLRDSSSGKLGQPTYLNGRPQSFPPFDGVWSRWSNELTQIALKNGILCLIPDAPVILDSELQVVSDYSSKYAKLIYFYDVGLEDLIENKTYIDATVISIIDDIFQLNYCHWITDWISRLAYFLVDSTSNEFFVAVSPITTDWQVQILERCGVPNDRILPIKPWQVVQARELVVLSDISKVEHPCRMGDSFPLSFLKSSVARIRSANTAPSSSAPRKLYISRSDASGRRIRNEVEFERYLAVYGYEKVVMSDYTFEQQVLLFSDASHIVAIHGAGLTNLIACDEGTTVLEIFPVSYGTPAFCVIALASRLKYFTYISEDVRIVSGTQFDDFEVNFEDFFARAKDII